MTLFLRIFFIGMNDRCHKIVSDDIVFIEIDVPDVFHMLQHALGIDEAALDMRGKIDLRGIAIDDHLRSVSEACQEHFDLLDGGILRFIKDDEGFLERASAHVGERRDFDLALLLQPHEVFRTEHIQQSVKERAKVRIDLFLQITGKEAQLLTGFDRRTDENDALDVMISERKGGECDSQIGLACPRGPMPKVME